MTELPADDTKQCPFCAETIKAAATVCRFCGREVVAPPHIVSNSRGHVCSVCGGFVRRDAVRCKHCGVMFTDPSRIPPALKALPRVTASVAAPSLSTAVSPSSTAVKQRRATIFGVPVLAVIAICCTLTMVIGALGGRTGSNATQTSATAEANVVATDTPAEDAEPTDAPTTAPAPTATPRPTRTPRPTATPRPAPTVASVDRELEEYLEAIQPAISNLANGLQQLGDQFSDNSAFGTDDWTLRVVTAVVQIQLGHEALVAITPPPAAASVHAQLLDATSDCNDAGTLLLQALDESNSALLLQSAELQQSCTEKTPGVIAALESLID